MTLLADGFPDPNEPTWFNQIAHAKRLYREKGRAEVMRHARVSIDNRHRCNECFCCACVEVTHTPSWERV